MSKKSTSDDAKADANRRDELDSERDAGRKHRWHRVKRGSEKEKAPEELEEEPEDSEVPEDAEKSEEAEDAVESEDVDADADEESDADEDDDVEDEDEDEDSDEYEDEEDDEPEEEEEPTRARRAGRSERGSRARRSRSGRRGRRGRRKRRMPAEARRYVSTLVVLLVVCVVSFMLFWPPNEKITQGLDIQGGVSVVLTATTSDGSAPSSEDMATAVEIVQSRVNSLGASEATVQQQGTNSILVQIPGATDAEQAVETIGQTGYLEFVRLDEIGDADALAQLQAGTENVELQEGTYTAFMDGSDIDSVSIAQTSTGEYVVNLDLNDEGTEKFAEVTADLVSTNGQIAIVLDGKIQSAPAVQSEITDGNVSISGGDEGFTLTEAQQLKTVLDSGSLPVTLTYSESRVVGPTLGQDSLAQGVTAIAIGAVLVVAYLFFFYRGLGILTMGSLAVFAVLYLGIMALLSSQGAFSLTLAGLAGMVLTIGMAADSSILVLERFREEIRMGRTVRNASISGVKHGIQTSLDADAVTLVTALALFFFAVGQVRGFGLTMTIGIVCDVATMFLFKAPALRLLARGTIQKHPRFWGISEDLEEAQAKADAKAAASGASARKGGVAHA